MWVGKVGRLEARCLQRRRAHQLRPTVVVGPEAAPPSAARPAAGSRLQAAASRACGVGAGGAHLHHTHKAVGDDLPGCLARLPRVLHRRGVLRGERCELFGTTCLARLNLWENDLG